MTDAWVYRTGRRREPCRLRAAELADRVTRLAETLPLARRKGVLEAAVLAGELESALADARHPSARRVADAADVLASAALGAAADLRSLARALGDLRLPEDATFSAPEGFAYYALHPEAYAIAADAIFRARRPRHVMVVGVRSIGTTLSAFVKARLAGHVRVDRMTVRPTGPSVDRRLALDAFELGALAAAPREDALFFVVDEGPGIGGSTLLAVVEALEATSIPRRSVVVLSSRAFDARHLLAPRAEERWRGLERHVVRDDVRRPYAARDLSGGAWRRCVWKDEDRWPASFASAERRKLLSGERLLKYEGVGSSAARARERAAALAGVGLSPPVRDEGDGWSSMPWRGRPMTRDECDDDVLDALAVYCALRPSLFPADQPEDAELRSMVVKNARVVLGLAIEPPSLESPRRAVVDSRMHPHEWLRMPDGSLRKVDAVAHGDDHFFPGPTDIAWDLAGAIVEWRLSTRARLRLLCAYELASGDRVAGRIRAWIGAYAAFRAGLTAFAMDASGDPAERARLAADLSHYRTIGRDALLGSARG